MPEKQKKTIRELTLMLMYLTSWEERDTPEMRAVKKKELEKYPLVRRCWKGYDHDLLNKLSEEGLINAAGRTYPALCALPGFVDSKNEEKTERNAGYLVVSQSGGGMLRQGTRKGIRRTPANRGMRAHRIVKSLDISEDVCHGLCP